MTKKTGLNMTGEASIQKLFRAISDRFTLVEKVALYKFCHGLPIKIPSIEEALLERVEQEALRLNLTPSSIQPFFSALFDISAIYQEKIFSVLHEKTREHEPKEDLQTELRPQILSSTMSIIQLIDESLMQGTLTPEILYQNNLTDLDIPKLSSEEKKQLISQLLHIKRNVT